MSQNIIDSKKFLYIESSQIPLIEVPYEQVKDKLINPVTKLPYRGIILEGVFADLSNKNPNNNGRYYDAPSYLEMIKLLKKQIWSAKGVYGELEHPKSYAIDTKNASHKLLDVWYDEKTMYVMGRLVILRNTTNGKIASDIIESGGQLAISARAAGEENKNSDGTFNCKVKLLTTFDLVYHPGFSNAVLNFKELNESQKFIQELSLIKNGFSGIVYEEDLKTIDKKFNEYIHLNESQNCFYEWLFKYSNLNESTSKQERAELKKDEKTLEDNESSDEEKIENNLKKAAEEDLSEKQNFFHKLEQQQQILKKKKLGKSFYDNSAGFMKMDNVQNFSNSNVDNTMFHGIDNSGFTY